MTLALASGRAHTRRVARLRRLGTLLLVFALGVAAVALLPGTARSGAPLVVGPGPPVRPGPSTPPGTALVTTSSVSTVQAASSAQLRLGQSANVQCGTGNSASSVSLTSSATVLDVRGSVTLTLTPTGGVGSVVRWSLTRTLVVGWPIPNTSDFGTLVVTGCTARYTAPANTGGNTPRMFVTIGAAKVFGAVPAPGSSGGEQGPTGVVPPATAELTIRGSGGTSSGPCGYGYISVLASVSGGTTTIVVDRRVVGYNIANVKVSPGVHSVTLYLPDGRTRSYTANVTDCQTWKITFSG